MTFNSATELGKLIGQGLANANSYKEDFLETEELADLDIYGVESINLTGTAFISIGYLSSSSFVLDHPIYSKIGVSTLKLSGIYSSSALYTMVIL